AEESVDPTIFMSNKPHVINVNIGFICLRHQDRIVPKAKAIDTVLAFGNGKKRFTISPLNSNGEYKLAFELHRPAIKCCVDTHAFEQIRVCFEVQIVPPEYWCVRRSEDRILITLSYPVCFGNRHIFASKQSIVFCL